MNVSRQSVASLAARLADWFAALVHFHVKADVTDLENINTTPAVDRIPKAGGSGQLDYQWLPRTSVRGSSNLYLISDETGGVDGALNNDASVADAKLADMAASKLKGRGSAGGTGVPQDITLGANLSMSGTTLSATGAGATPTGTGFRHVVAGVEDAATKLVDTADVNAAQITDAKLRNSAAASVIGRAADASGQPADIVASPLSSAVLREDGAGGLSFGTLATAGIADDAVTNAKLANMNSSQIKGRAVAAGVGDPTDLSAAQARAVLNVADGANAYVHPNHSGDVTSVADGAQTIAADAVTYAKMQNVSATDKVLGRSTAGAGDVEEIACTAAGRALIDDADASAQRTTLGLGTLATQSGTFSGTSSGTNTGDQTITLTGNVTGSGTGSFAATIAANAVTNAKLAQMANATVKGRNTAGTGDPEDVTTAQLQVLVGTRALQNVLVNGSFAFAQRQAPATLTTYSNTTGRTYGPDYWTLTNENASVQFQRVDTAATPVTGVQARYHGVFKKITSTGKVVVAQVIECEDVMPYRGRTVTFQMRGWNGTGSHTLRMVLLQLTSSGTLDTIPATFVSAFGAASTDPTWGTNLTAITPATASAACSISGAGLSCVLSGTPTVFSGTFAVPSNCLNLIAVIFTHGQPVANDTFNVTEAGLFDGTEERVYVPASLQIEFARCQRRCYKTFDRDTAPAQSVGGNTGEHRAIGGAAGAVALRFGSIPFAVPMRLAPTITTYNPAAANAQVRNQTIVGDCSAVAAGNTTERGTFVQMTGHASGAVGNLHGIHILAEDNL